MIEVGPDAWGQVTARAVAGDKVLISKYAGVIVHSPVDGKEYRLCNDEDIFCKITAESWEALGLKDPIQDEMEEQRQISEALRAQRSGNKRTEEDRDLEQRLGRVR